MLSWLSSIATCRSWTLHLDWGVFQYPSKASTALIPSSIQMKFCLSWLLSDTLSLLRPTSLLYTSLNLVLSHVHFLAHTIFSWNKFWIFSLPIQIGLNLQIITTSYKLFLNLILDGDCSHEIKRCLLLGRKVMTDLNSIFKKQRHYFAD